MVYVQLAKMFNEEQQGKLTAAFYLLRLFLLQKKLKMATIINQNNV